MNEGVESEEQRQAQARADQDRRSRLSMRSTMSNAPLLADIAAQVSVSVSEVNANDSAAASAAAHDAWAAPALGRGGSSRQNNGSLVSTGSSGGGGPGGGGIELSRQSSVSSGTSSPSLSRVTSLATQMGAPGIGSATSTGTGTGTGTGLGAGGAAGGLAVPRGSGTLAPPSTGSGTPSSSGAGGPAAATSTTIGTSSDVSRRLSSMLDSGGPDVWRNEPWGRALLKEPAERTDADVDVLLDWAEDMAIGFFQKLSPVLVRQLCKRMMARQYEPQQVVVKQGDRGESFFVLVHGQVAIYIQQDKDDAEGGQRRKQQQQQQPPQQGQAQSQQQEKGGQYSEHGLMVNTLGPGAGFGELALLSDILRTATIVTKCRSMLLEIDRAAYNSAIKQVHTAKLQSRVAFLAKNFLFQRWAHQKKSSFAYAMRRLELPRKAVVYRQDDPCSTVYFIESGECVLMQRVEWSEGGAGSGSGSSSQPAFSPSTGARRTHMPTNGNTGNSASAGAPTEPSGSPSAKVSTASSGAAAGGLLKHADVELATLGAGEFFGEVEVLERAQGRLHTVVATSPVVLYEVKSNQFRSHVRGPTLKTIEELILQKRALHQERIRNVIRSRQQTRGKTAAMGTVSALRKMVDWDVGAGTGRGAAVGGSSGAGGGVRVTVVVEDLAGNEQRQYVAERLGSPLAAARAADDGESSDPTLGSPKHRRPLSLSVTLPALTDVPPMHGGVAPGLSPVTRVQSLYSPQTRPLRSPGALSPNASGLLASTSVPLSPSAAVSSSPSHSQAATSTRQHVFNFGHSASPPQSPSHVLTAGVLIDSPPVTHRVSQHQQKVSAHRSGSAAAHRPKSRKASNASVSDNPDDDAATGHGVGQQPRRAQEESLERLLNTQVKNLSRAGLASQRAQSRQVARLSSVAAANARVTASAHGLQDGLSAEAMGQARVRELWTRGQVANLGSARANDSTTVLLKELARTVQTYPLNTVSRTVKHMEQQQLGNAWSTEDTGAGWEQQAHKQAQVQLPYSTRVRGRSAH